MPKLSKNEARFKKQRPKQAAVLFENKAREGFAQAKKLRKRTKAPQFIRSPYSFLAGGAVAIGEMAFNKATGRKSQLDPKKDFPRSFKAMSVAGSALDVIFGSKPSKKSKTRAKKLEARASIHAAEARGIRRGRVRVDNRGKK